MYTNQNILLIFSFVNRSQVYTIPTINTETVLFISHLAYYNNFFAYFSTSETILNMTTRLIIIKNN